MLPSKYGLLTRQKPLTTFIPYHIIERGLDHRERCFDIRPLTIML